MFLPLQQTRHTIGNESGLAEESPIFLHFIYLIYLLNTSLRSSSRIRPGSLLFILYTTPLSTVISNSSANHNLYDDNTQLLLSLSALDFSHNITHLENTVINVSNWMSSNFLSLSLSKTEFLIFGLP